MVNKGGSSRRRFRVLPTVLLTVAILGFPSIVYAWGRSSSSFQITHVCVSGTDLIPRRAVLRLLQRDHLGENLFSVTHDDVRRTLEPLAYMRDVRIDRDFPDTLRVRVVEHRPAIHVLARNGWYVVADDGYVICGAVTSPGAREKVTESNKPRSSPATTAGAPQAQGGKGDRDAPSPVSAAAGAKPADLLHVGALPRALRKGPPKAPLRLPAMMLDAELTAGRTADQPAVPAALRILDLLPASLRRAVLAFQTSAEGGTTVRFSDGLAVRWGTRERSLAKTLALRAVLRAYTRAGKKAAFLDVSVPDRVLARPILK